MKGFTEKKMTDQVLHINSLPEHSRREENARKDSSELKPLFLSRPASPGTGVLGDSCGVLGHNVPGQLPGSSMNTGSQEVVLGQPGSLSSELFMKELMMLMAREVKLECPCLSTW